MILSPEAERVVRVPIAWSRKDLSKVEECMQKLNLNDSGVPP